MNDNDGSIITSVTRIDHPKALVGKHSLSFTQEDSTHSLSVNLTEGELIDTWVAIGAYLNLNGMRNEAYSAYLHLDETED